MQRAAQEHWDEATLWRTSRICTNGSWNVGVYKAAGEQVGQLLGQGQYARLATNVLTVTYNGGKQTIAINGGQVAQFTDAQAYASEFIGLGVFNAAGNPQATFGQFEIDALS